MASSLWLTAAACFAAFAVLGAIVAPRTPTWLDVEAVALQGQAVGLAVFFTRLGRWYGIGTLAAGAAAGAVLLRGNPIVVLELFIAQALAQGAVNALKPAYRRPRPDDWLHRFERGFSYPSGHATTAIVFFLGLLLLVVRSPEVPRHLLPVAVVPLVACVIGIPWSRVALGAHYATDVIGGLLFGAGWLAACVALAVRAGIAGVRF